MATKADAASAEYTDAAEVTLVDDITLFALWMTEKEIPLTLKFIGSGRITIKNEWSTLKFSLNGGRLEPVVSSIPVTVGDKVCFYAKESGSTATRYQTINSDADCYVYGNIMSLVTLDENGGWNPFETELKQDYTFFLLFKDNTHIRNHESKKLLLPATELKGRCYKCMFLGCTSLEKAPELPAEKLLDECYMGMFANCERLNFIKCLATNKALQCVDGWVEGVSSTGKFIYAEAVWSRDTEIPYGWRLEKAE